MHRRRDILFEQAQINAPEAAIIVISPYYPPPTLFSSCSELPHITDTVQRPCRYPVAERNDAHAVVWNRQNCALRFPCASCKSFSPLPCTAGCCPYPYGLARCDG